MTCFFGSTAGTLSYYSQPAITVPIVVERYRGALDSIIDRLLKEVLDNHRRKWRWFHVFRKPEHGLVPKLPLMSHTRLGRRQERMPTLQRCRHKRRRFVQALRT